MITWQTITVAQYQRLYSIFKADYDALEKEVQIIALLSNKTETEVEALPLDAYKALRAKIAWAFEKMPEGKPIKRFGKYKVIRDVRDLDTGRYISINTFLQGDLVENLHHLMACIIKPRWGKYDGNKHAEYAAACQDAPFLAMYQTAVFFCKVFADSMKGLQPYLAAEAQKKGANQQQLADLKSTLDGLQTLSG